MFPWGHLAFGYIVYTCWARLVDDGPADRPTLALVFATQLPDLVDKLLMFWFSLYHGRAIFHSLLVMGPLCIVLLAITYPSDSQPIAVSFTIGTATHLIGDAWRAILTNSIGTDASYLLWPLLPAPIYQITRPSDYYRMLLSGFKEVQGASLGGLIQSDLVLGLVLSVCFGILWVVDGFPGIRTVWQAIRSHMS